MNRSRLSSGAPGPSSSSTSTWAALSWATQSSCHLISHDFDVGLQDIAGFTWTDMSTSHQATSGRSIQPTVQQLAPCGGHVFFFIFLCLKNVRPPWQLGDGEPVPLRGWLETATLSQWGLVPALKGLNVGQASHHQTHWLLASIF